MFSDLGLLQARPCPLPPPSPPTPAPTLRGRHSGWRVSLPPPSPFAPVPPPSPSPPAPTLPLSVGAEPSGPRADGAPAPAAQDRALSQKDIQAAPLAFRFASSGPAIFRFPQPFPCLGRHRSLWAPPDAFATSQADPVIDVTIADDHAKDNLEELILPEFEEALLRCAVARHSFEQQQQQPLASVSEAPGQVRGYPPSRWAP
eukprot:tig00000600_g2274.t1